MVELEMLAIYTPLRDVCVYDMGHTHTQKMTHSWKKTLESQKYNEWGTLNSVATLKIK